MSMRRVETIEQLSASVGMKIEIGGELQRSKAGDYLEFHGLQIWCKGGDWEDCFAKRVRIVGHLGRGASPLQDFPVATKDENGGWSQGVVGLKSFQNNLLDFDVGGQEKSTGANKDWCLHVERILIQAKGEL